MDSGYGIPVKHKKLCETGSRPQSRDQGSITARSRTVNNLMSPIKNNSIIDGFRESDLVKKLRYEQVNLEVNATNNGVKTTLMNLEKLACTDTEMM